MWWQGISWNLAPFSWSRTHSRRCWWKMSATFMPQAAETRAKVNTMTPIRARSRSPTTVSVSIERNSSPASSAVSMGVLPLAELLARCLHGQRRVVLEHTAGDQVIEQHADSGHVLLEGGGREAVGFAASR